ncbi:hypothetical protein KIN20_033153 [Parelaphostrongylus tenuis]|uniref:Uncharacterized protein n=1 Tax=Parelaphostrongylus tenuis TaxID=148309 RepID=A0AAD5WIK0_PARTN|nr:hypothetical protein KIN20_033153 [Parelaphostrongylus tenuis]
MPDKAEKEKPWPIQPKNLKVFKQFYTDIINESDDHQSSHISASSVRICQFS